jgi:hypothetical protein
LRLPGRLPAGLPDMPLGNGLPRGKPLGFFPLFAAFAADLQQNLPPSSLLFMPGISQSGL